MGQFKPMVKMETTEPTVELKLKRGGVVKMKNGGSTTKAKKMAMGGGAMEMMAGTPALVGRPAVNAPVQAPGKPSMAMRRKAMMAKGMGMPSAPAMPPGNPGMPAMKKGGMAEGGDMESKADERKEEKMDMSQDKAMIKKAFKQHDMQEHKGGKGTSLKLKKGGMKKATGGVALGNGGGYATGGVALGNGGGYATGGVALGNGGGYRKGGATKKFADGGKVQNDGGPEKMPQGRKPASQPVAINMLSGAFKNGGKVAPGNKASQAFMNKINAPAMREAKADSVDSYAPMGSTVRGKRMADGGSISGQGPITNHERKTMDDLSRGAYDKAGQYSRELEDAMNPLSMAKELYGKARNAFSGQGPITDKERSILSGITKKRGGMAC